MQRTRPIHVAVTVGFLAAIFSAGIIQAVVELRRGERPQALEVFRRPPTIANLRAYERDLEDASWVARQVRPWAQDAQFTLLCDAGAKAIVGRDGWLFYKPGVEYLTQRPPLPRPTDVAASPLAAIVDYHNQLSARGIALVVVPVPNKESIYPEMLTRRADHLGVAMCRETCELLGQLREAGIEAVDLFEVFGAAKHACGDSCSPSSRLYLAQDSHWSPAGAELAADAVAERILARGWCQAGDVAYGTRRAPVRRLGDVLQMLQVPQIERQFEPEAIGCSQVMRPDGGGIFQPTPQSEILVIGDSFLRIFEQDEPLAAGLIAHVARALRQPVAALVSDGGASTLVRQELYRRPALLAGKKVVVWEFAERDIRLGAEGWQLVPLPRKTWPGGDVARARSWPGRGRAVGHQRREVMDVAGLLAELHIEAGVHRVHALSVRVEAANVGDTDRPRARRVAVEVAAETDVLLLGDVAPTGADLLHRAGLEILDEQHAPVALDAFIALVERGQAALFRTRRRQD